MHTFKDLPEHFPYDKHHFTVREEISQMKIIWNWEIFVTASVISAGSVVNYSKCLNYTITCKI